MPDAPGWRVEGLGSKAGWLMLRWTSSCRFIFFHPFLSFPLLLRALPTETKVGSGTFSSKSGTSVNSSNSFGVWQATQRYIHVELAFIGWGCIIHALERTAIGQVRVFLPPRKQPRGKSHLSQVNPRPQTGRISVRIGLRRCDLPQSFLKVAFRSAYRTPVVII